MSDSSDIRNSDFIDGEMKFEYEILHDVSYEKRNKLLSLLKFLGVIFNHKFDKIIFPGWELVELIPIMLLSKKSKNGIVLESSIIETITTGPLWLVKKLIIRNMGHAYPSGKLQSDILSHAGFDGEEHVTHGVGIPKRVVKEIINRKSKSYKYLYVGRISEEKNLDFIVNEFNNNGKSLTIVGDGPQRSELESISHGNIKFTGYVNNADLGGIYRDHHIFILPSKSEPWGLVVEEALSYGLPVIVSNHVGCYEDLVSRADTGIVFDLSDEMSFARASCSLESNYDFYQKKVQAVDFSIRDQAQINAYCLNNEK
ncbi:MULTISPECIES: glycosyltransferase family 4 protein [unclassified Vibrio]|uniref:glycosyltransferase family 4 protein n=1 Tax=unclassified Vibrio TaxID=2614977 RepID=UPI0035539DF5